MRVVAPPAPGGSGGVHQGIPDIPARQSLPPPACLPPLPPASANMLRGVYQPQLHRAPDGQLWPRLRAGAHRLADWLVPTTKTATAETAARNFISLVFSDVGLPGVLVSDRNTRFTSAFWTSLHGTLGASLIFGSQHH